MLKAPPRIDPKSTERHSVGPSIGVEQVCAGAASMIRRAEAMKRQAIAMSQEAIAIRKAAIEMKLSLWLKRLAEKRMNTSLDTALEEALDAALSVASADCANIQLVHRSGRGLELKAQRGFSRPFLDFFAFVDDDRTACGLAYREHRPVVVPDVAGSPIFTQTDALHVILEAGIRAVASTPLIGDGGRILGMLSVHYRRPCPELASGLIRFQTLAKTVAGLIEDR